MKTFDVEIELSLDRAGKYGVDGPYDAPTIRMDPFRILRYFYIGTYIPSKYQPRK